MVFSASREPAILLEVETVTTAEPLHRRGKQPRPQAISNEEVWRRLQEECSDVHPFVMRWCAGDEGVAWEAMFSVGRLWIPGKGASFRTYVRSWAKLEAYRLHLGGGARGRAQQKRYAILTQAQRVFGEDGELQIEDVLSDDERTPEYEPDELAELGWALEQLREKESRVLRARFFEGVTLQAVADELDVYPERVRQLQAAGLARARELIEARRKKTRNAGGLRAALQDVAAAQPAAAKPDPVQAHAQASARDAARERWRAAGRARGLSGKALAGFVGGQMRREFVPREVSVRIGKMAYQAARARGAFSTEQLRANGRATGSTGASWAGLTPEQRSERNRQGALKRWARARAKSGALKVQLSLDPEEREAFARAAAAAGFTGPHSEWVRACLRRAAGLDTERERA